MMHIRAMFWVIKDSNRTTDWRVLRYERDSKILLNESSSILHNVLTKSSFTTDKLEM